LWLKHVSGASDFIADTLSRNPAGLNDRELGLTQPCVFMVSVINLGIDNSVGHTQRDPLYFCLLGRVYEDVQAVCFAGGYYQDVLAENHPALHSKYNSPDLYFERQCDTVHKSRMEETVS
jgi:hypothetical protein